MQSENFWLLTEITVADDRHYAGYDLFLAEAVGSSLLCLKGPMRALRITMSTSPLHDHFFFLCRCIRPEHLNFEEVIQGRLGREHRVVLE